MMAITTLDGLVEGFHQSSPRAFMKTLPTAQAVGTLVSLMYQSGFPGASVAPTPGLAGAALTSYAGSLPFENPSSGNAYFTTFAAVADQPGVLWLIDRLWHNSSIVSTTTTGQTINSVTWPARDRLGATSGSDVMVGLEVSTATTNGSPITNTTITYTNQSGTGSKTGPIARFPANALAGTFIPFNMAAGDSGVRSIQTLTLGTSYGTGVLHLVAYRVLARLDLGAVAIADHQDFLTTGFVRTYDNTVPCLLWHPAVTTTGRVIGRTAYAHG